MSSVSCSALPEVTELISFSRTYLTLTSPCRHPQASLSLPSLPWRAGSPCPTEAVGCWSPAPHSPEPVQPWAPPSWACPQADIPAWPPPVANPREVPDAWGRPCRPGGVPAAPQGAPSPCGTITGQQCELLRFRGCGGCKIKSDLIY